MSHPLCTRRVAAAALLAASVLASACGADSRAGGDRRTAATRTATPALPGTGREPVTIGDKNFTEQFVLGELYAQALRAQGYDVQLNRNIGPLEVTMQALRSGRLAMYPEYLGTWNTEIAGDRRTFHSPRAAYLAGERDAAEHGLAMLEPTRFSDTGAIAVTTSYAVINGLRTLRDLRTVATDLTLGAPPQFAQSAAGLPAVEQAYGFVPAAFTPLAIGAQYQALDQGRVQAAQVSTTDGQLKSGDYVLLADPQHVFGFGQVVPIVPPKVLVEEGPAFEATINLVSRLLTISTIRRLNAAVDVQNRDPAVVARAFLEAHGLVKPTGS